MKFTKIFILLLILSKINLASAATIINVNKGNIDPISIALAHTADISDYDLIVFEEMNKVIANDLESTGLFKIVAKDSHMENIATSQMIPNFELWKNINADFLSLNHMVIENGKINFTLKIWNNFSTKIVSAKTYTADRSQWRRISHIIADEIYSKLTGEYPYFNSQITYVSESNSGGKIIKKLAVMDQDGENHHYITSENYLVLTPRFSPDSKKILYMSYKNNLPRVHLKDLTNGNDRIIGNFPGMSFAPRFSPDGRQAILSVANKAASNIYLLDLERLTQKKLTSGNFIDTSPSFSPDGKNFVFTSDRNGSPKLYIMNINSGETKQLSTGQGTYTTPVWSPREDLIAFTRTFQGKFYIGVIRPDGSGERLITQGYMVEGPSWAPNGRVIMFTRANDSQHRYNESNLYTIDITGANERRITTPHGASGGNWSKILN